jgi:hypothetical protein
MLKQARQRSDASVCCAWRNDLRHCSRLWKCRLGCRCQLATPRAHINQSERISSVIDGVRCVRGALGRDADLTSQPTAFPKRWPLVVKAATWMNSSKPQRLLLRYRSVFITRVLWDLDRDFPLRLGFTYFRYSVARPWRTLAPPVCPRVTNLNRYHTLSQRVMRCSANSNASFISAQNIPANPVACDPEHEVRL